MATTLAAKDALGVTQQIAVVADGSGNLTPVHLEDNGQRSTLLASLAPLATAALQTNNTNSIVAAIQASTAATQAVSLASLPLPTGAATASGVAAIVTALGTPLQAGGAVTVSGVATSANQTTSNTSLAAIQASVSGTLKVDTVVQATSVSRSGTITTGGTAQVLMAANGARRGFVIQNNSSAPLYINGLGTATSDGLSLNIAAGALYETSVQHTGVGAISVLGATTGQAFYAREF